MFYLDLSQPIQFIECEYRKFLPDEKHITRKWNKSVILFLLKNSLNFEEDGMEISVPESSWYIQREHLLQRGTLGSPSPEYFYIHFNGTYIQETEGLELSLPITGTFDIQTFLPLFQELYESQHGMKGQLQQGNIIFQYILVKLKKLFQTSQNVLSYKIANHISQNFNKPLYLKNLAREYGYCEDYLERVFKKTYEMSVHQYITYLRVEKAKQLLLYSNRSITQISEEVGYTSPSIFYKAFIKREKISPRLWRKKNR